MIDLHKTYERDERLNLDVEVYLEVVKGQLDDNVSWSKDLKLDEPIDIFIVLDSTKDTKENVYHVSQKIQKVLNDEGYAYQMVTINGNEFDSEDDGYVKFSLSFQKDTVIQLRDVDEEK